MTDATTAFKNRIVGEAEVAPGSLAGHPLNWRKHSKRQLDALEQQMTIAGWVQRLIVSKRSGVLLDGHARLEIALRRGEPTVPVVYVDVTREEEALVLSTLDPLGAMADRDQALLEAALGELPTIPFGELSDMLAQLAVNLDDVQPKEVTFNATPRRKPAALEVRVALDWRKWADRDVSRLNGREVPVEVDVAGQEPQTITGELVSLVQKGEKTLELRVALPFEVVPVKAKGKR